MANGSDILKFDLQYLGEVAPVVVKPGSADDTTLDWSYLGQTQTPVRTVDPPTLQASLTCQSSATPALATNITMASALVAVDTVVSAIINAILIASSVQATTSLTAALTTDIRLAAVLSGEAAASPALQTDIKAAAALASQSSLSGDFSRLYATLAAGSTLTADMQGGSIFESHMVCQSSILASLLGETITMEALLACDSETTSALTTDIRMLAPLGCEADLSADLVAATNGASLNALLRVQSTVSIPRNPGLSTKKNAKSNFKVGSIDGCVCTLTASLRTGKPIAAALGCESITNGGLVCEARFATGLHVQSAITPNAVFNITMAGALQSLASFSPGALSTNITMATVLGDTVTVTPPNLKCGVFFAAPLQAQCTLTPNAQFSIRLSAQLACDTEFTSDLITQAWAHFASNLTCAVAAHAALVTDIIMVAEPMLVESLFQADTTTGIRMACTITGGGVQVIADLLTDINLLAAFLSTQATFNDLRVYKRALVFKNGKLQQVPLGEEGMHAPAAMQAGFIHEGASGSPLYIRLGVIYESTPQDDVIV